MKKTILTLGILIATASLSFGQWYGTGPVYTWDEVRMTKFYDLNDLRYVSNPGFESVLHHFKVMNGSNVTTFSVDNDGTTHVNATLKAKQVSVQLNVWADYVFKSNYELMSLSNVEEFITKNNHLPNVPSEKEVCEDGINLGEMDAILLRKIEELTLYMIDLKKENEELRDLIETK